MSEKKGIKRYVIVALAIIAVMLAVGLAVVAVNHASIIGSKDNTITSLEAQMAIKDDKIASLNDTVKYLTVIFGGQFFIETIGDFFGLTNDFVPAVVSMVLGVLIFILMLKVD